MYKNRIEMNFKQSLTKLFRRNKHKDSIEYALNNLLRVLWENGYEPNAIKMPKKMRAAFEKECGFLAPGPNVDRYESGFTTVT